MYNYIDFQQLRNIFIHYTTITVCNIMCGKYYLRT